MDSPQIAYKLTARESAISMSYMFRTIEKVVVGVNQLLDSWHLTALEGEQIPGVNFAVKVEKESLLNSLADSETIYNKLGNFVVYQDSDYEIKVEEVFIY
jgi:peptidyl-tRNA hydrolase